MFSDEFDNNNGANELLSSLLGFIIRIFLAATTAGFFATYAVDIWTWLFPPSIAVFVSALTGVVLIDSLAAGWTYLRRTSADTEEQQRYAQAGAWMDIALSLLVTAVYVVLTTPLLIESVSTETFAMLMNFASWLGVIIGVVAFAGNGLVWHYYANASSMSVEQLAKNRLRALARKAEHEIEMERLKMWTSKALAEIRQALPEHTGQAAARARDDYINTRFTGNNTVAPLPETTQADTNTTKDVNVKEYYVQTLQDGEWKTAVLELEKIEALGIAQGYAQQGVKSRVKQGDEVVVMYRPQPGLIQGERENGHPLR